MVLCQLWLALMLAAARCAFVRPWLISDHIRVQRVTGCRSSPCELLHCLQRTCFGSGAEGRKPIWSRFRVEIDQILWDLAVIYMQTSVLLKYILLILFFFHLEWFSLFFCSFPTWGDLHGCSAVGTVIWTVLCGLMWNDWGVQVYLFFAVRFTFFPSFLLSVCSFTLGSLCYFSYYLWDNCCIYCLRPTCGDLMLSARQMLLCCHQESFLHIQRHCWWI